MCFCLLYVLVFFVSRVVCCFCAADSSVSVFFWFPPPISALIQVGLPGAVEAHESVGGVPESVWKKVQTVKQGGGGLIELKEKVCIEAVQSEEPQ